MAEKSLVINRMALSHVKDIARDLILNDSRSTADVAVDRDLFLLKALEMYLIRHELVPEFKVEVK